MRPSITTCLLLLLVFGLGSGACSRWSAVGSVLPGPVWEVAPNRVRRRMLLRGAQQFRQWIVGFGYKPTWCTTHPPRTHPCWKNSSYDGCPYEVQMPPWYDAQYAPDSAYNAYSGVRLVFASGGKDATSQFMLLRKWRYDDFTPDVADVWFPDPERDTISQRTNQAIRLDQQDDAVSTEMRKAGYDGVRSFPPFSARLSGMLIRTVVNLCKMCRLAWPLLLVLLLAMQVVPAGAAEGPGLPSMKANNITHSNHLTQSIPVNHQSIINRLLHSVGHRSTGIPQVLAGLVFIVIILGICSSVQCMIPGSAVPRMPPSWGPDMESRYPFRQWSHDVLTWSIAADGDPSRKAALLAMSMKGTAYEFVRTLPPLTLVHGGLINGAQADPLTYLMHALAERFAALGEELRLSSVTDMLNFRRSAPGERIDELLTRFDLTRQRAHDLGQLTVSVTGLAWILLRACEVTDNQLLQLLMPYQGRFPQNEAELTALKVQLRRMGHILEQSPGNIAATLRGGPRQQAFWANSSDQPAASTYFGSEAMAPTPEFGAGGAWNASGSYGVGAGGSGEDVGLQTALIAQDDSDAGTDTDTASSSGLTEVPEATPEGLSDVAALQEHLFWAYARAKAAWRKFMGRPTRVVWRYTRRYISRKGGKTGKGKGAWSANRPNVSSFLAGINDEEASCIFKGMGRSKGRAKGKGKRSSGKGKGRMQNPLGKDGQRMRCFRCGSETHLSRECHLPRTDFGRGGHAASSGTPAQNPNFYAQVSDDPIPEAGPLAGLIFMAMPSDMGSGETESSWSVPTDDPWAAYLRQQGAFERSSTQNPDPPSRAQNGGLGPSGPSASAAPSAHSQSSQSATAANETAGQPTFTARTQAQPTRMIWEHRPSELPAFASLPIFGFMQPLVYEAPQHAPIIGGGRSSVEGETAETLDAVHRAAAATHRRWTGQPFAAEAGTLVQVQSTLDTVHRSQFDCFSQAQHVVQTRRTEHRNRNRHHIQLPDAWDAQPYDGLDTKCPLCQDVFLERDSVVRLVCRHLYHTTCWADFLVHPQARMSCPVCRGSARVISRFSYHGEDYYDEQISPESRPPSSERQSPSSHHGAVPPAPSEVGSGLRTPPVRPENFDMSTPPQGQDQTEGGESPYANFDNFESFHASNAGFSSFPWWPCVADTSTVLHSTSLNDFQSLLIDPGAYTNLAGLNWVRRLATRCQQEGLDVSQQRLQRPMVIQGVGNGTQQCTWSTRLPIQVPSIVDGKETSSRCHFEAPVVGGSGSELPALLGLKSLREKNAILILSADDEGLRLVLPGPGGTTFEHSPGTVEHPLCVAPSGHLLLRCDLFEDQGQPISLRGPQTGFMATPVVPQHVDCHRGDFLHALPTLEPASQSQAAPSTRREMCSDHAPSQMCSDPAQSLGSERSESSGLRHRSRHDAKSPRSPE